MAERLGAVGLGLVLLSATSAHAADTLPASQAEVGYLLALQTLQESCANGLEDSVLIDLKTGDFEDVGRHETATQVEVNMALVAKWAKDPAKNVVRNCHCHPNLGDEAFDSIDSRGTKGGSYEIGSFNMITPSLDDVISAAEKLGVYHKFRPSGRIDFCIVPAGGRGAAPTVTVYGFTPQKTLSIANVARGYEEPMPTPQEGLVSDGTAKATKNTTTLIGQVIATDYGKGRTLFRDKTLLSRIGHEGAFRALADHTKKYDLVLSRERLNPNQIKAYRGLNPR